MKKKLMITGLTLALTISLGTSVFASNYSYHNGGNHYGNELHNGYYYDNLTEDERNALTEDMKNRIDSFNALSESEKKAFIEENGYHNNGRHNNGNHSGNRNGNGRHH